MKKVIVTGANGFIGSYVCKELSKQDIEIIAVVRNEQSRIDNIEGIPGLSIYQCEMAGYRNLPAIIKDRDIDVLFHFAWEGTSGEGRGNTDLQLNNIHNTISLVSACKELGIKRFVFASSIMEYEIQATINSNRALEKNSVYCSAKMAANVLCNAIANDIDVDYVRGIISNVYGPGEISPRLINTSLRKMISREHCSFSPGEQLYDFIYCTDAAKAFVAIARNGQNNKSYYIGSLRPRPLKEYLIEMRNCVDPQMEIGLGEVPYHGISLTYHEFDINAVKKDTGFIPEVSFPEGIMKTVEWLKEIQ